MAHFDDDDWSGPERLRDQVRRLVDSGKAVTGYRTMRFTDGRKWWLYTGGPEYALGTSLVYRRSWWAGHKFPAKMISEDNDFVHTARAHGQIVVAEAGDLMFATVHQGNTSPRNLHGKNWRTIDAPA